MQIITDFLVFRCNNYGIRDSLKFAWRMKRIRFNQHAWDEWVAMHKPAPEDYAPWT